MRKQKEISAEVLSRGGRYRQVEIKGKGGKAKAPLQVKEVWVGERRYIICYNEDQARKDASDREAIVASLTEKLKRGVKQLVGNKGYRKYLQTKAEAFAIDAEKIKAEARYDGKWVLRTNTDLSAADVALKYKQLWMVELVFRTTKSVLETRPIFHKCDETIRGHVFCSFLALMLLIELQQRLRQRGSVCEWNDIRRDLEALQETELVMNDQTYYLRTPLRGTCLDSLRACGISPPPTLRQ
jgi:IS4 transposase